MSSPDATEGTRPAPPDGARIVVWGAGAMGGTIGARLVRAGRDVLFVDADEAHVRAMNEQGLRITGPVDDFTVEVEAVVPTEVEPGLSVVLLAVKAHHTRAAIDAIAPLLTPDGCVVSVQNGLNESVIADLIGQERTVGCFVNYGADVLEPGVISRGNRGAVVVGELDGARTARIGWLHDVFTDFEPDAVLTGNISGYLWGKLAYGAILFATALEEASIADVLANAAYRPALIGVAREAMAVAAARGIRPEPFDGFDPAAFAPDADESAAHRSLDRLVEFNRASTKTHSGVWRDIAVRKRKTEVDAQIAPIVSLGSDVGVPAPRTARLVELVHDVEEGRRPQGSETLSAL